MCILCQLPTAHEAERLIVANYIDPGSGYVVQSFFPFILGILSTLLGTVLFFFRRFIFPTIKKFWIALLILLIIVGIIGGVFYMGKGEISSTQNKVVILAFDGMDPNLLEDGIKKGKLPNFKKLKEKGSYNRLRTTVPPQSPVAWASFSTGTLPSKHKVYDFIRRDPKNYSLDLTFSQSNQWHQKPFWDYLSQKNIPMTILFLPDTFPPSKLSGKMISGMGVPDTLGTQGTLNLFTTRDFNDDANWRGKRTKLENTNIIETEIQGPKYKLVNDTKIITVPLTIERDRKKKAVKLTIQGQKIEISEGQFSRYIPITFKIDFFTRIHGLAKFYLKSAENDLELYLSPMTFDPKNPVHPISYPQKFAKELSEIYGTYTTLGLPHDTWALDQGVFNEDAFLKQANEIISEREKIYFGELSKFKKGLFFGYFGFPDTISHMFWRFLGKDSKYSGVIEKYYQKADEILGKTLGNIKKDDILIVLSDHGFSSFDYEMNVNSYLRNEGYLVLKDGKTSDGLFENIDWSKTRAYAAGYNGIFLNKKGRESEGIVEKKNVENLEKEISEKLLALENPLSESKVFKHIYNRRELGIDEKDSQTPDLFLGFYKGIRSSWDTAIGGVPSDAFRERKSKWSGDHLFDPSEVPGILLANVKVLPKNPKIIDIAPTILNIFNSTPSNNLDGESLFKM